MHLYYTYILQCSDGKYYVGVTNDLPRRLQEHQAGLDPRAFTYHRRPVELVYYAEFQWIQDVISFEKQLKGWSRQKKEALITGDVEALPGLSRSFWRRKK